jgi:hypothetical protein
MRSERPIRLAGAELGRDRHACAFFHSKEEGYRVLLPFVKEGFERNEKSFHIVDPAHQDAHRSRLADFGVDVQRAEARSQLEVRCWQEAYLRDGHFDQNRMLELIEEVLSSGKTQGFGLTLLWANMEWALEDRPGVGAIAEYETRLNYVLPKYEDPVVCTYDLSRFDAGVVMDIMRTHPTVIIGGILQENPFFVPPDQMLEELKERRESVHRS